MCFVGRNSAAFSFNYIKVIKEEMTMVMQQAGAELGQAQLKLGLGFPLIEMC